MLEVSTESLELKSSPDGELSHCVGLGGPSWELVGVGGIGFLKLADDSAIVKEENLGCIVSMNSYNVTLHSVTRCY